MLWAGLRRQVGSAWQRLWATVSAGAREGGWASAGTGRAEEGAKRAGALVAGSCGADWAGVGKREMGRCGLARWAGKMGFGCWAEFAFSITSSISFPIQTNSTKPI